MSETKRHHAENNNKPDGIRQHADHEGTATTMLHEAHKLLAEQHHKRPIQSAQPPHSTSLYEELVQAGTAAGRRFMGSMQEAQRETTAWSNSEDAKFNNWIHGVLNNNEWNPLYRGAEKLGRAMDGN